MTIEERANKYAVEIASDYDSPDSEVIYNSAFERYVKIANEQKAIDDAEILKYKEALQKSIGSAIKSSDEAFESGKKYAIKKVREYMDKGSTLLDILNINNADDLQEFVKVLCKSMED